MLNFILAVVFTVSLYLMMRAFPKYRVNPLHAVIFNYYTCVVMGLLLMPAPSQYFNTDWTTTPTLLTLALGIMFVIVFVIIGLTATKVGVTVASLAGNMSLVIPVLFGLFIFKNNNKDFTIWNYLGLLMALAALALSTIKKEYAGNVPKTGWILFLPRVVVFGKRYKQHPHQLRQCYVLPPRPISTFHGDCLHGGNLSGYFFSNF
jgi:drug/metabolite transporter (DMT)-like permease